MTRLPLLGLLGAAFALAPAHAQTAPSDTTASDSTYTAAADSAMAMPAYDTAGARALNAEALAAERTGDFTAALAAYDQALVADPTYPPALLGRGNMLSQLGRNEEARAAYEATAAASQAPEYAEVLALATRNVAIVSDLLAQAAATERETAAVAEQTAAVESATALLATDPVTPEAAQQAFDQLEAARAAGYDPSNVAFYYAKALNVLERGVEALPYAEQALAATLAADSTADASAFYIQLGIAQRYSGNDPAAREAFNMAKTGTWASWADHYLSEMGPAPAATTDGQ